MKMKSYLKKLCIIQQISAKGDVDMNALLGEIIKNEVYKEDFENITSSLLFKPMMYDEIVKVLEIVIEKELFR